jgi:hypothetical protein
MIDPRRYAGIRILSELTPEQLASIAECDVYHRAGVETFTSSHLLCRLASEVRWPVTLLMPHADA